MVSLIINFIPSSISKQVKFEIANIKVEITTYWHLVVHIEWCGKIFILKANFFGRCISKLTKPTSYEQFRSCSKNLQWNFLQGKLSFAFFDIFVVCIQLSILYYCLNFKIDFSLKKLLNNHNVFQNVIFNIKFML